MALVVDRPRGQFREEGLTEKWITFDRNNVCNHVHNDVISDGHLAEKELIAAPLGAVREDVCARSDEVAFFYSSGPKQRHKHIGRNCYAG